MERLVKLQWTVLRAWLEQESVLSSGARPCGLGTWSLEDLVAHLGLGLRLVAAVEGAPPGAAPLTFGQYVAAYQGAAADNAQLTQQLAADLRPDLLGGLDRISAEAWATLERQPGDVLLGKRGAISRDDYLLTRLVELVVHAEDVRLALPGAVPSPVLAQAQAAVAGSLAAAYAEKSGVEPEVSDAALWIRQACGRVAVDDPHLPLL